MVAGNRIQEAMRSFDLEIMMSRLEILPREPFAQKSN